LSRFFFHPFCWSLALYHSGIFFARYRYSNLPWKVLTPRSSVCCWLLCTSLYGQARFIHQPTSALVWLLLGCWCFGNFRRGWSWYLPPQAAKWSRVY